MFDFFKNDRILSAAFVYEAFKTAPPCGDQGSCIYDVTMTLIMLTTQWINVYYYF